MKIAFCSSEVFPFAKTGGLADVSGALPFALAELGCDVKVFMPFYKKIEPQKVLEQWGYSKIKKVEFYFIKNDEFYFRDGLYGNGSKDYADNLERFTFYSSKIIEILKKSKFRPDIVHANDWQTVPLLIQLKVLHGEDAFFKKTKTVLTIHNLAYQGLFEKEKYPVLGIPWDYYKVDCLEYYGKINLLKGGIVFADMVNTVSPTYAKQICTKQFGCGLEGVLCEKKDKLQGILNAVDYKVWDPKKDQTLYKNYSPQTLQDKAVNKNKLQKDNGLAQKKSVFLMGMVSRLAEQKGIDILSLALDKILKTHQVIILGLGDEKYHKVLKAKVKKFPQNFSLFLGFDEKLAHRIYAGSDAFLMPSRFEPCGLSQLISYKYATVPIVHHTGGLVDTVIDYEEGGGGFVFTQYHQDALVDVVDRVHTIYRKKDKWAALLKKITKYNFSWTKTAKEYVAMYKNV